MLYPTHLFEYLRVLPLLKFNQIQYEMTFWKNDIIMSVLFKCKE